MSFGLGKFQGDILSYLSRFDSIYIYIGGKEKEGYRGLWRENCLKTLNCLIFTCLFMFKFQILTPFLLRRLKSDVALEVPPKREVVVYAPLSKKQEIFYTAIVNRTIANMFGCSEVECGFEINCK